MARDDDDHPVSFFIAYNIMKLPPKLCEVYYLSRLLKHIDIQYLQVGNDHLYATKYTPSDWTNSNWTHYNK